MAHSSLDRFQEAVQKEVISDLGGSNVEREKWFVTRRSYQIDF